MTLRIWGHLGQEEWEASERTGWGDGGMAMVHLAGQGAAADRIKESSS